MKPDAHDVDLENKSLTELCEEIEREIESLFVPDSLPAQVFEALFPGLESPKDKKPLVSSFVRHPPVVVC
ncbi:MAG: hypothetical protein DRP38_09955 [Thermotogae bacterium]|nr:MAG: hypothetical protein DRP38_09955 [Thermotogota bacterium]